jgi:adenylate cyclase
MTDIILDEEGTVDKYEGDSVMAFWNAPLNVPDHAERAVRAALRCHSKLAEIRPCFRERFGNDIFMRIGINTGAAVAGNMGSRSRFNYTIIGDAVNLASRLEGANKQFGTGTIISQWTMDLLGDGFETREIARLAVVGRKEPVKVYEPVTKEEYEERKSIFETFSMGLDMFYRGNFKEALKYFGSIDKLDKPAAAYSEKCKTLKDCTQGDWKGVWVLTEK